MWPSQNNGQTQCKGLRPNRRGKPILLLWMLCRVTRPRILGAVLSAVVSHDTVNLVLVNPFDPLSTLGSDDDCRKSPRSAAPSVARPNATRTARAHGGAIVSRGRTAWSAASRAVARTRSPEISNLRRFGFQSIYRCLLVLGDRVRALVKEKGETQRKLPRELYHTYLYHMLNMH